MWSPCGHRASRLSRCWSFRPASACASLLHTKIPVHAQGQSLAFKCHLVHKTVVDHGKVKKHNAEWWDNLILVSLCIECAEASAVGICITLEKGTRFSDQTSSSALDNKESVKILLRHLEASWSTSFRARRQSGVRWIESKWRLMIHRYGRTVTSTESESVSLEVF